ncbi:hypothetical protein [Alteromonas sp. CYL-A6]|uniref:hypothetical protein n=1 Tax=Alteromonas nitratireducens TaxID=3390813 RepID=UPI0034AFDBBC
MIEIIETASLSTLLYVAALIAYSLTVKRITAFSFVLVGLLMLEGLHMGGQFLMASYYNEPAYTTIIYYSWYLFFAVTDFLYIGLTVLFCRKAGLAIDRVSYLLLSLYAFMGGLQVVRLIERTWVDTQIMEWFYTNSIPFINIVIGIILLAFVSKVILTNVIHGFKTL